MRLRPPEGSRVLVVACATRLAARQHESCSAQRASRPRRWPRAIIARKNDYYRLLRAVTAENAWLEWIIYMLEAVRDSATSTTQKIAAIRSCQDDIAQRARVATPGGRNAEFLDVLFEHPYCRIATVVDRCDVSRQTASSWLHALVAAGLFSDVKAGRELLFVNHEFLHVLIRPERE